MIDQHRVVKNHPTLLKIALGLAVVSGLCLPNKVAAVGLQTSTENSLLYNRQENYQQENMLLAAGNRSPRSQAATLGEIVAELNRVRKSPVEYAVWLETLRSHYQGNDFKFPGEAAVRTSEGVTALDAAIYSLSARSPISSLTIEPGLALATQTHLEELIAYNRFTLSGVDGSTPTERAERHGSVEGQLMELLSEGPRSAEAIVAALIVDDGNRGRSTQEILLNPEITSVGAACGASAGLPLCVFDYAAGYISRSDVATATASTAGRVAARRSPPPDSVSDPTWFGDLAEDRLAELSEALIAETNIMRANPAAYAEKLAALRAYYAGTLVAVPGRPAVQVVEGVSALDEAIAVLRGSEPLGALAVSPGMSFGANDHASDLGGKGITGHYGSDGSDPFARLNRYGRWSRSASENISYGQATIAEWHLINLLVDDNVPGRGHREALLEPSYSAMGSACHEHSGFRIVCVMNYASEYQEGNYQSSIVVDD